MYRWDHDIRPVSTVDRIRYIQNCLLLYQRGGIRALSTAPIWTEYRYLQNKSAAGLGNFDCIIISMFDFHTVHLKCFCSFMCPLNVFPTYLKNFNENFSLEYAEKMAKSKQQKIH